jgi:radical SAM superfamily enzyme YgiQ (UPF0313 family)
MKIALIITSFEGELPTFSTKPYSLLSLSSYLKSKNIESDVFDFTDVPSDKDEILRNIYDYDIHTYDLIGFSAYFENYESSKLWAILLKKLNPKNHITIGGYCPTIAHEHIIKTTSCFDSAIRGYGEMAFFQLYLHLSNEQEITKVSNLTYLSANSIIVNNFVEFEDLDEIGIINNIVVKNKVYNYETTFELENNLVRTIVPIIASRGCPFPCFFCLNRVITKKYTVSPLELVIFEIEASIKEIEYPLITFWDPNFLIKEDLFMGILQYLKSKNIPFTFGTTVSQLLKNRKRLSSFLELGLRSIEVGIENVNDDINKSELGKVQFARDCWELIELLASLNIYCVVDFINYTAKSKLEHIKNNINFLKFYFDSYPLQEYYHFSSFGSQLCYYVGSKSFELLQKDLQFDYVPTSIYYASDYFYDDNVSKLFKFYRKFTDEYLKNFDNYYAAEFEKYQINGTLKLYESQNKLKEIRDLHIRWYECAFELIENEENTKYEDIIEMLLDKNPNYKSTFESIKIFNHVSI